MKIVHISKYKRFSRLGTHTGGVAKHAWYLQQAIPELEIYAWGDFPKWQEHDLAQEWEQAPLLSEWLLKNGLVGKDTIAIVDGWWGMGLEGKVARLISVCHGSYAGAMVEHLRNPWNNGFLLGQSVRHQEKFWKESGCEIVAVSPNAAGELRLLTNLDSTIICNGIDLEVFHPSKGKRKRGLILEATGGHPAKGAHIVEALKRRGYQIEAHGIMDGNLEHEAKRWARAEIALLPSFYEGYSYALLEAMACGCIPVSYFTGLAATMIPFPGELTDDHHEVVFARLVDKVILEKERYGLPRQAVLEYNHGAFEDHWRNYLGLQEEN